MALAGLIGRRWLLPALLVLGAAAFVVGIAAERSGADVHTPTAVEATHTDEGASTEVGHTDEAPGGASTSELSETSSESVLGVSLESTALVVVATAASLGMAALTWRLSRRWIMLVALVFAAAFAAFDIAEVVHQIHVSRAGVAALAAIVALLHIAAASVAAHRVRFASTSGRRGQRFAGSDRT